MMLPQGLLSKRKKINPHDFDDIQTMLEAADYERDEKKMHYRRESDEKEIPYAALAKHTPSSFFEKAKRHEAEWLTSETIVTIRPKEKSYD